MKEIEIFWTGGYDSTFRVCQLSRKNVIIQPYYLSDKRQSEKNELEAIKIITEKLINNPKTTAIIKPLIYISIDDRIINDGVTKSYASLRKRDFMGSQYEWLGAFASKHEGIEMSIHNDDKAILLIKKHGTLKLEKDITGSYYIIDKRKSSQDCINVFGNAHFPLANYTKLEMKEEYSKMGLEDIINYTWFCFTPINNKPCGTCNPCKYTIEEGMSYRFDEEALQRYKKSKSIMNKMKNNLKRIIKKLIRKH